MDMPSEPSLPTPAEGNTFSTITLTMTQECSMRIEHPAKWNEAQLKRAVNATIIDIGREIPYCSEGRRTSVTGIALGKDAPTDERCEPFVLTVKDATNG